MAKQPPSWEDRGRKFAEQATDAAIAKLEEELQAKQRRLNQIKEEPESAQKRVERSQLLWEVADLNEQLIFARDLKPKVEFFAAMAGSAKDPAKPAPPSKGCFG